MVDGRCRDCGNSSAGLVENKEMSLDVLIRSTHFCANNFNF